MNYSQIAELLRAAGQGQTQPFMQNGASWNGNAYEEAKGRASSFYLMAEVFEKVGMLDSGDIKGCICPPTSEQTCKNQFCPRQSQAIK